MMRVIVPAELDGARLDRAASTLLPEHSRSFVVRLMEEGRVAVGGVAATKPSHRVAAVVYGIPKQPRGTIDAPIARDPRNRKRMAVVAGGRRAVTEYEVVERLRHASLVRCVLRTGRTHQIRVHLKSIGHPIVGDPIYSGPQWRGIPDKRLQKAIAEFPRQALHAARLVLPSGAFEAPLPEDMR